MGGADVGFVLPKNRGVATIFVSFDYFEVVSKRWHNLFSAQRIDENIAANAPVRIVNAVVDNLNLDKFKKLYKATGCCPYHPKMMLKVIIYAYMNNIYSFA